MRSAYQWGLDRDSCPRALAARQALGPEATQADWWRVCPRGDWLLWQLEHGLSEGEYDGPSNEGGQVQILFERVEGCE